MIVVLLIVHGLLAVTLLGAITHQALSVVPSRAAVGPLSFVGRFRSVDSGAYANAIVVLFVVVAALKSFFNEFLVGVADGLRGQNHCRAEGRTAGEAA